MEIWWEKYFFLVMCKPEEQWDAQFRFEQILPQMPSRPI